MKMAASLDGTTAFLERRQPVDHGCPARRDGHAWRKRAGAILTGIGTVLEDDPRLDVRLVETDRQLLRARRSLPRLEIPAGAKIIAPPASCWSPPRPTRRRAPTSAPRSLELGVTVIDCPGPVRAGLHAKVDLPGLLQEFARRAASTSCMSRLAKLNGSLLREGLVDELLLYLAPRLLGPGMGWPTSVHDRARAGVELLNSSRHPGRYDLRIRARVPGRVDF